MRNSMIPTGEEPTEEREILSDCCAALIHLTDICRECGEHCGTENN